MTTRPTITAIPPKKDPMSKPPESAALPGVVLKCLVGVRVCLVTVDLAVVRVVTVTFDVVFAVVRVTLLVVKVKGVMVVLPEVGSVPFVVVLE